MKSVKKRESVDLMAQRAEDRAQCVENQRHQDFWDSPRMVKLLEFAWVYGVLHTEVFLPKSAHGAGDAIRVVAGYHDFDIRFLSEAGSPKRVELCRDGEAFGQMSMVDDGFVIGRSLRFFKSEVYKDQISTFRIDTGPITAVSVNGIRFL